MINKKDVYVERSIKNWIFRIIVFVFVVWCFVDFSLVGLLNWCYAFIVEVLIILIFLIVEIIRDIILKKHSRKYEKRGVLNDWYMHNVTTMGLEWIKDVYNKLIEQDILSITNKKVVFSSPTANQGVFEKELYKYLLEKETECTFIISDGADLQQHEQNETNGNSKYIYLSNKNANDIENTLKSCGTDKCDILWDFKGYIWYLIRNRNCGKIIEAFEQYKNVIDDEGMIVLDNFKKNKVICKDILRIAFGIRVANTESSTIAMLERLISGNKLTKGQKELKEYIETNFIMYDVCASKEFPNVEVRVFKKKSGDSIGS